MDQTLHDAGKTNLTWDTFRRHDEIVLNTIHSFGLLQEDVQVWHKWGRKLKGTWLIQVHLEIAAKSVCVCVCVMVGQRRGRLVISA